jgi:hypothetical protein
MHWIFGPSVGVMDASKLEVDMANTTPKKKNAKIIRRALSLAGSVLLLILAAGLFACSLFYAQRQDRMVTWCVVPVEATVLSSTVADFSTRSERYLPEIEYQYTVNGKTYRSARVTPVLAWGTKASATRLVGKYIVGETCTAYYNPRKPGEACLLRRYSATPYLGLLLSAFLSALTSRWALKSYYDRSQEPVPIDNGTFELMPQAKLKPQLFITKVSVLLWYGIGAFAAMHYSIMFSAHQFARPAIGFGIFGLLGWRYVGPMIYWMRLNSRLEDARLFLEQPAAILGRPCKFTISQPALSALRLNVVRLELCCCGTAAFGMVEVLHKSVICESKGLALVPGGTLEYSGNLTPPLGQRPTGRDASGNMNRIWWKLLFVSSVQGAPDYVAVFPIEIRDSVEEKVEAFAGSEVTLQPVAL